MTTNLKTERLFFRGITEDHLDDFHALMSHPVPMSWTPAGPSKSRTDSHERILPLIPTATDPHRHGWLIFESDPSAPAAIVRSGSGSINSNSKSDFVSASASASAPVIGMVALMTRERVGGPGCWELGYSMLPEYHGKGYATEAVKNVVMWAKEEFGGREYANRVGEDKDGQGRKKKKLVSWIGPANTASLRVVEKVGMRKVEHKLFPGERFYVGGKWRVDGVYVYEMEF